MNNLKRFRVLLYNTNENGCAEEEPCFNDIIEVKSIDDILIWQQENFPNNYWGMGIYEVDKNNHRKKWGDCVYIPEKRWCEKELYGVVHR